MVIWVNILFLFKDFFFFILFFSFFISSFTGLLFVLLFSAGFAFLVSCFGFCVPTILLFRRGLREGITELLLVNRFVPVLVVVHLAGVGLSLARVWVMIKKIGKSFSLESSRVQERMKVKMKMSEQQPGGSQRDGAKKSSMGEGGAL